MAPSYVSSNALFLICQSVYLRRTARMQLTDVTEMLRRPFSQTPSRILDEVGIDSIYIKKTDR